MPRWQFDIFHSVFFEWGKRAVVKKNRDVKNNVLLLLLQRTGQK